MAGGEVPCEREPELKKPKLEEEDEADEFRFNDDSKEGFHEMTPEEWGEYFYHLNKSGGYDVPEFPKAIFYGIQPCDYSDAWVYWEVKQGSILAIEQHNKEKGTNYVYHRLIKVNMEPVSGVIYYITFLAEDLLKRVDSGSGSGDLEKVHFGRNGGLIVELQAKVYYPIPDKEGKMKAEVMEFKVKDGLSEEGLEITFLAEDLNRVVPNSGAENIEKVKVGPNGAPLFELQAHVFYPIPDEERKINIKLLYFHVKDAISEEGLKRCRFRFQQGSMDMKLKTELSRSSAVKKQ